VSSQQANEGQPGSDGEALGEQSDRRQSRRGRLRNLGVAAAIAAVVVVVLVVVSQQGGEEPAQRSGGGGLVGVAETRTTFAGIPQDGTTLGDPEAPMVLTEFIDLQCFSCRQAAIQVLPGVIETYVRTGRLRLELRTLTFVGPDSVRAAKAAHAAATRDLMWNFTELWFLNQGEEGSGYATNPFIGAIAQGVGVNPQLVFDGIKSPALQVPLREAERQAQAAEVQGTPTFLLGRRPGRGKPILTRQLTFESFQEALEPELSR